MWGLLPPYQNPAGAHSISRHVATNVNLDNVMKGREYWLDFYTPKLTFFSLHSVFFGSESHYTHSREGEKVHFIFFKGLKKIVFLYSFKGRGNFRFYL